MLQGTSSQARPVCHAGQRSPQYTGAAGAACSKQLHERGSTPHQPLIRSTSCAGAATERIKPQPDDRVPSTAGPHTAQRSTPSALPGGAAAIFAAELGRCHASSPVWRHGPPEPGDVCRHAGRVRHAASHAAVRRCNVVQAAWRRQGRRARVCARPGVVAGCEDGASLRSCRQLVQAHAPGSSTACLFTTPRGRRRGDKGCSRLTQAHSGRTELE